MTTILLAVMIFLELIMYIVFADVILSWLTLAGIKFRPKFLADIIDPLYKNIKSIIPTSIGPVDFTPIVVIMIIYFIKGAILLSFPEIVEQLNQISK